MNRTLTLIWASIKGFGVPVLIAIGIVAFELWSPWQPDKRISEAGKSFIAALFFIMYFYGQYKRVEKQTDDKESFKGVNEKLLSLEDLVKQLHAAKVSEPPSGEPLSNAESLLRDSQELLKSGHILAALLQGGVAFEHAVRNFARRYNPEQADGAPLMELIKRIEFMVPQGLVGELHALRMIRNRMTHVSERELNDLPDADTILASYQWAITELSREPNGIHEG